MDADLREKIVAEALTWQGTPYAHEQATKHLAADCALFPLAVYRACGVFLDPVPIPKYSGQWYLHHSEEIYLESVLALGAIETEELKPGNFIIWKIGRTYSHGGIILAWPNFIHALKPRGVIQADALTDGTVARKPYKVFTA